MSVSMTQRAEDIIKLINTTGETDSIKIILADRYPVMTFKEIQEYAREKNIKLIFTATDCPSSNGLNERVNQTLVNRIRCKINSKKKRNWTKIAEKSVEEYNHTRHSVTGFAPNHLLYGKMIENIPKGITEKNWFTKRHQPMSKKPEDLVTASLSLKFDKSKVVKAVKETLGKKSPNSEVKHKVVWDNTSGTKVDAQLSCISRYDIVSCLRAIVGERRNARTHIIRKNLWQIQSTVLVVIFGKDNKFSYGDFIFQIILVKVRICINK